MSTICEVLNWRNRCISSDLHVPLYQILDYVANHEPKPSAVPERTAFQTTMVQINHDQPNPRTQIQVASFQVWTMFDFGSASDTREWVRFDSFKQTIV